MRSWLVISTLLLGLPSAAAASETLLVLPFQGAGRPLGDVDDAVHLRVMGALEAMGGFNLVHRKQLNRAVEHYESAMADRSESARRKALMTAFGADRALHGTIVPGPGKVVIELRLVGRGRNKRLKLEGADLMAALGPLPERLHGLLKAAGAKPGKLNKALVTPRTEREDALLKYAACHSRLIQQPIGIRFPVVLDQDNLDRAVTLCKEALKLDSKLIDAEAALGFAYALKGAQAEAEASLAKTKDAKPFLALYWIGRYWALSRFHHPQIAARALEEAIEAQPGFLLARGYLGDTYAAMKRYDNALKTFKAYLAQVPKQPWVMGRLGYVSARRGDMKGAIRWTQKAMRAAPTDSELLLEMASRYVDAKEHEKAVIILKRLIGEGAARGEVYLRLGYAYLLLGKLALAEKELQVAIKKANRAAEWRTRGRARYDLAKLWAQSGLLDKALEQLQLAVEEGYRDRDIFERDPDFEPLLKDPRFKRILDREIASIEVPKYSSPFKLNTEAAVIELPKVGAKKNQETVLLRF